MTTQALFQIIYISESVIDDDEFKFASMLESITATSRENNAKLGVTGALLASDRYFAQVLEGPEAAVLSLFKRIARDNRHTAVHELSFEPITQRSFDDWSMTLVAVHPDKLKDIALWHRQLDKIEAREAGKRILDVMEFVVSSRERSRPFIEVKNTES